MFYAITQFSPKHSFWNRAPSLEAFYKEIQGDIDLYQSAVNKPYMGWMIKSCRLKPFYLFHKPTHSLQEPDIIGCRTLYKKWFDEFGYSIIHRDRHPRELTVVSNDLTINRKINICTDIFYGLTIDKALKISKMFYLYVGTGALHRERWYFAGLLGIDNYWRCYLNNDGNFVRVSPLIMNFMLLRMFYYLDKEKRIPTFQTLQFEFKPGLPVLEANQYVMRFPLERAARRVLRRRYPSLWKALKQ